MMPQAEQYPFVLKHPTLGDWGLVPCLPIQLIFRQQTLVAEGLLDTASAIITYCPTMLASSLGPSGKSKQRPCN